MVWPADCVIAGLVLQLQLSKLKITLLLEEFQFFCAGFGSDHFEDSTTVQLEACQCNGFFYFFITFAVERKLENCYFAMVSLNTK